MNSDPPRPSCSLPLLPGNNLTLSPPRACPDLSRRHGSPCPLRFPARGLQNALAPARRLDACTLQVRAAEGAGVEVGRGLSAGGGASREWAWSGAAPRGPDEKSIQGGAARGGAESAGGGEGRGLEWHSLAWRGLTVCSRLDGLSWFRKFGRAETGWVVCIWPRIEARTRVTM